MVTQNSGRQKCMNLILDGLVIKMIQPTRVIDLKLIFLFCSKTTKIMTSN